jgi:hypothetical protein
MANVTGQNTGMGSRPYVPGGISLEKAIIDIGVEALRVLDARKPDQDRADGILLRGTKYLEEVYRHLLDIGVVSVFRGGIDEPLPPNGKLCVVDLDLLLRNY